MSQPFGSDSGHSIDVQRLLDELEQIVENGRLHVFGKVLINEEEFFDQTTKIKRALPEVIRDAERIRRDSDRILGGAQTEAQRLVAEAQGESQRLLSEARAQADRAVADSRARSDRQINDARNEAERITADARQHSEQLVAEHSITRRSQEQAEELQRTAEEEAEALRRRADEYGLEVLERAASVLGRLLDGVEKGKDELRQVADTPPPTLRD